MNKGFEKFKSKLRRGALLRSLILGASCGTLSAAAYMTIQKQRTYAPDLLLTLAIGGGVALVVFLVAFLVMRPTDKQIAKKLDNDLGLDEKVQTMLAYKDQDSVMLTLQREDTNRRLEETPAKAVRYRHPWKHIIAPVLACALMVVAVVTPIKAVPPPVEPDEPTFEMSTWQQTALQELIEKVKASGMDAIPKATIVTQLESLLTGLGTQGLKASEMKQMVVSTIVATNRAVRDANTADDLNLVLSGSETLFVSNLGMAVGLINGLQTKKVIDEGRETLRIEEVAPLMADLTTGFDTALSKLSETFDTSDAAYVAVTDFVSALKKLDREMGDYTKDWAQEQLDSIFEALSTSLNKALLQQNINKETGEMVVTTLMTIFELTAEDIPPEEVPTPDTDKNEDGESPDDKEEDKATQGGIGDGNLLFGSDDEIFSPADNEHVIYGDVILDYYKIVSDKILDGNLPEGLEQFISDYFDTLFDGSASKDED